MAHPPAPDELVRRHGGSFARALGIELASADPNERFRWFLASLLYGARISEALATRAWRELDASGIATPSGILQTGWDRLVAVLDAGGYVRYDYKTATKLIEACGALLRDYGGNLDTLHAAADGPRDLETRLQALGKGIGATTVGIFLRELRGIWEQADPPLAALAAAAARELGYLRPADEATAAAAMGRLSRLWAAAGQPAAAFPEFEAALVREGLQRRRVARRGRT